MKKVMKSKGVIAIMAVGLLTVLVAATGVLPASAVIFNGSPPPVASKINYQGQLRDSAGNPLDGTYDMQFLFYDSAIGGVQVGSTITKNGVEVTNGLFSVKLDVNQDDFNAQELWLEVRVAGETLSPRQEILPVPYALSLRPGADILGTLTGPVLFASNDGAGITAAGLWGTSVNSAGVYGESMEGIGVSGVGHDHSIGTQGWNTGEGVGVLGYSATGTAISAEGTGRIESTADSYIFIPGYAFVRNVNTDTTRWDCQGNGSVLIWRGATPNEKFIYIPITVPGVLYGQDVFVEEITIYYRCQDGTKNYIANTCLWVQTGATSYVELITDYTYRTSNTATSYTLTPTAHEELASNQGVLSIHMRLNFGDDTNYIQLGGVRLRLGHYDPGY
jgi:hypothetical protein